MDKGKLSIITPFCPLNCVTPVSDVHVCRLGCTSMISVEKHELLSLNSLKDLFSNVDSNNK